MKYTVSIEIALPREKVAQMLADPEHLPKWLHGLVLHEPLSGLHGQVGTRSRVVFQTGQQQFEGVETITRREPLDLHGIPRHAGLQGVRRAGKGRPRSDALIRRQLRRFHAAITAHSAAN